MTKTSAGTPWYITWKDCIHMSGKPEMSKYNDNSVFTNILVLFEYLKARGWVGLAHSGPCFECMQLYGDRFAAAPMPMSPLYRGESEFHPVCKPNIFRKEWTETERLEMEIQMADFKRMLECHPQIQDLKNGGLYVNYTGLAQHYGLKTNVLDLTNSPLVAAFFATTEYDSVTDAYRPILDSSSEGVLYFFPLGGMFDFDERSSRIWPIGQEALRRPGEQRGYGIEMREGDDLNTCPDKILLRFKHSPETSVAIWNASRGGTMFFPYDPMAEKVRAMMKYRIYSKASLEEVYAQCDGKLDSVAEMQNVPEDAACDEPFEIAPEDIPTGDSVEDRRKRQRIIFSFYRHWRETHPQMRMFNDSLGDWIYVRHISVDETAGHASLTYLSTLAVLQLDAIMRDAVYVGEKEATLEAISKAASN